MPDVERALVREFLDSRSQDAFRELYRRHSAILYGLAVRLAGRAEAEDVAQEAWLRAVSGLRDFRWGSTLRTWLCGIVVNCCRERWRAAAQPFIDDTEPPAAPRPERALDLESALAQVAPGYRTVVVLHDVYGHTHQEIADLLGCEAGTSKSQLARGRRALRDLLGHNRDGRHP